MRIPSIVGRVATWIRHALPGKGGVRVAYESEHSYIVTFGEENGLTWGRIVEKGTDAPPGPLVPVGSIAAHCPYEDFVPFTGDPAPILARVPPRQLETK